MQHRTTLVTAGILAASVFSQAAWQDMARASEAASPAPVVVPNDLPPLPVEYVPLSVIERDRKLRAKLPKAMRDRAFMQPQLVTGEKLPANLERVPGAQQFAAPPMDTRTTVLAKVTPGQRGMVPVLPDPIWLAQAAGRPAPPAAPAVAKKPVKPGDKKPTKAGTGTAVRPPMPIPAVAPYIVTPAKDPVETTPQWVRYPLEFQMCGIGIGSRAVDKDKFNRIDRYGLFAMHGNPTAVVVPTVGGGVTVQQQPPAVASLFQPDRDGGLPDWAGAITVGLDNNHVEWLYNRDTYSMGFGVDRLGFVDAIVVAGIYAPIAKTQLEDKVHTIQLGDDLRKLLFRYGYPDTIETYTVNAVAGAGVPVAGGAGGAGAGATPGAEGAPGAGAGAAGGAAGSSGAGTTPGAEGGAGGAGGAGVAGNAGFRTFEFRYEQSYNVVFTIRDNRVVKFAHFAVMAGTGHMFIGNHFFQGDDETAGVRRAGLIFTQPNLKTLITGNYIDNSFIEWSNEHDPEPGFSNEFSFGGLTVTGNIFTVSDVAPWFRWFVITPRGPGHYIQGLNVAGNTFRTVNCTVDRIEMVDSGTAALDLARLRNVVFEQNAFNGVTQVTMSPVVIRHAQVTAADTWVVDGSAYLPFGGRARTVPAIAAEGAITTAASAVRADMPYVLVEQGAQGALANLRWPVAVKGTVQVTLRCDSPI